MTVFKSAEKFIKMVKGGGASIYEAMECIWIYPDSNMCANGHQHIMFRGKECPMCGLKRIWRFK
jgi:hypothetical protein